MKPKLVLGLTVLISGVQIFSVAAAETNSVLLELSAAAAYLQDLKKLGVLPGVTTNREIEISTGRLPGSSAKLELKYPLDVTLRVTLAGESFTNYYTAVRPEAAAAWQLKKAWRTDAQGATVKTWPVKSVPKLHSSATATDRARLAMLQDRIHSSPNTQDPLELEIRDATSTFVKMAKAGQWPTMPRRGNVTTKFSLPNNQTITYPLTVTFLVNESGESFTNHYNLVRPQPGAAWRPGQSWRTDSQGRTVEEWPQNE